MIGVAAKPALRTCLTGQPAGRMTAPSPPFAGEQAGEGPGALKAASGEALGIAGETIGPFQTGALHPARGTGLVAGKKVDVLADAEGDLCRELIAVLMNPQLLLGCAEAGDQHFGAGLRDTRENRGALGFIALKAGRRSEAAGDLNTGPLALD